MWVPKLVMKSKAAGLPALRRWSPCDPELVLAIVGHDETPDTTAAVGVVAAARQIEIRHAHGQRQVVGRAVRDDAIDDAFVYQDAFDRHVGEAVLRARSGAARS